MIYFDNSSTSFPKAPGLGENICNFITNTAVNINRGSYENAFKVEEEVFDCRLKLANLFNCKDCKNIIFTNNVTTSLNIILKGFLHTNDHVLLSSMEHNAIMRPLNQLNKQGLDYTLIPCDKYGYICIDDIKKLVKKNTKAIICTHVSNVCGTIMPIKEVGQICKELGLYFIVDAAQSAGAIDIDIQKMNISALCFTGHKALLGPQGIGGFAITDEFANKISPIISGGTGSFSDEINIPNILPDKFEAGTLNLPGIIGLNTSLDFINKIGISNIYKHEIELTDYFLGKLKEIKKIKILGYDNIYNRSSVISIIIEDKDLSEIGFLLEKNYSIQVRTGLHCAPMAHKALGSFPNGSIRFSFSYFNTKSEVKKAVEALKFLSNN